MGCQSTVYIGDYLTFSVCCHDPDTAVLTDADAAPIYRIYEDETAVPILTGTMAILDNANTTGFYTERVACTAANGFEDGKSYTIYISATVDGATGGICYGFRAISEAAGAGAISKTITITDNLGAVLDGAEVWVTTDLAGTHTVANGVSDALGHITFWLDAGSYYVFAQLGGYNAPNPTVVVWP